MPDPRFYSYPRREREIFAAFTELYDTTTILIQETIANKKFF